MAVYLGNDVVDLTSVHVRGKSGNRRFTGKVLTELEMDALEKSGDPDSLLWCFWAAKESAYKALSRHDPMISSAPKNYETAWQSPSVSGFMTGTVRTPSMDLPVFCSCDGEKICGLCFLCQGKKPVRLEAGVHRIAKEDMSREGLSSAQSRIVRDMAGRSIAEATCNPPDRIAVVSGFHGEAPDVTIHGSPTDITLTLSHDGPFLFFAWCRPERNSASIML
jgi:hypothetical protein